VDSIIQLMSAKDVKWMKESLKQAENAMNDGEIPIGSVVVAGDEKISEAYPRTNRDKTTSEHAEVVAIRKAGNLWNEERELTLYTTLQPCIMCLATAIRCGFDRIVYAAEAENEVNLEVAKEIERYGTEVPKITGGVKEEESVSLFKEFLKNQMEHFAYEYVEELMQAYN